MKTDGFSTFRTLFDTSREMPELRHLDLESFYHRALQRYEREGMAAKIELFTELQFIQEGRSYCKVFPSMVQLLRLSTLDVPCSVLDSHPRVFEIRMKAEGIIWRGSNIRSLLVGLLGGSLLAVARPGMDSRLRYVCNIPFVAETLEDSAVATIGKFTEEEDGQFIRLACAVSCFVAGRHDLVAPDIEPPHLITKRRQHVRGAGIATKPLYCSLGREITLPTPIREYVASQPSGSAHILTNAHLRRGHLRMQAVGPREQNQRKLIWVMPTIVRPDLPEGPARNYRIPDPRPSASICSSNSPGTEAEHVRSPSAPT